MDATLRTEIKIEDELLDRLSAKFFWLEKANHQHEDRGKELTEITSALMVARVRGLSIKIWADEHPPPHFHVSYQGQDASFSIVDCSRLPGVKGMERYEYEIREWWENNASQLIEKWNASRPADCPVGFVQVPETRRSSHAD